MAQRWRSRARRDPDLDDDNSPPRRQAPLSDDEDEEAGNEDLSLDIVARVRRREAAGGRPGFANLLSLSSGEEFDEDAVVELGEANPRRKQKKKRLKAKKQQRKEAPAAAEKEEVGGSQEGQTGTAESVENWCSLKMELMSLFLIIVDQDTLILGKLCWRLALIMVRKAM